MDLGLFIVWAIVGFGAIIILRYWWDFGPPARKRMQREMQKLRQELAEMRSELAALEALTEADKRWLRYHEAMNNLDQPWPLPEIGSFWDWGLGNPMHREVVEVTYASFSPEIVRIKGSSGEREVSLLEFNQNAVPAPLGRHR